MIPAQTLDRHVPELRRIQPNGVPLGWKPKMRRHAGYCKPAEWYQSVVERLVTDQSKWVDIGGGHQIFPSNPWLATELSQRCKLLVGVDPSDNLVKNEFVHEKIQSTFEEACLTEEFDLATLHMVAEHVEDPSKFCAALGKAIRPGGHVVILTPYKWSIASIVAALTPEKYHSVAVRSTSPLRVESDVFPTHYRLNTRRQLRNHLAAAGFEEVLFRHIADLSLFQRFRAVLGIQLAAWRLFNRIGLRYPESNLLAVYRRVDR